MANSAAQMTEQQRETMIIEHMQQVKLIAKQIHSKLPGNVNLDDLISAGTLGLITAIDRFDPNQDVKLRTYAEYKIRGAILDSLRTADWAPRLQRKRARMIDAATATLEKKLTRNATQEEIAAELNITIEEFREWASDAQSLQISSLDSTPSTEDGRELMQFVAADSSWLPSEAFENSELRALIARALERMPQNERTIVAMYYHQEMPLREISKVLNLHESRISQLKTQGVNRLRALLASRWPNRGTATAFVRVA